MRILVAGGAGFIGGHFTELACRTWPKAQVSVLDNLSFAGVLANLDSLRKRDHFRFIKGDIADPVLVRKLLKETDLLVNFAAETHVDRSLLQAGSFVRTDVLGTFNLLETARQLGTVRKLILMSTDEVYGPLVRGKAGELARLNPSNPYSAAKASGDLLALSYARSFGLPVIVPRACNVYGPRQFPEKLIPLMSINAIRNALLPLYGNGRQKREWLHVEDVCRALLLLAGRGRPGRIVNIGSSVWKENIHVVRAILKRLDRPSSLVRFVSDRPAHDIRYGLNWSAIRALGFRPRVRFNDGLEATVDWYRDHPEWWRPLLERAGAYFKRQYGRRPRAGRPRA